LSGIRNHDASIKAVKAHTLDRAANGNGSYLFINTISVAEGILRLTGWEGDDFNTLIQDF
jgi:hypothetical protein